MITIPNESDYEDGSAYGDDNSGEPDNTYCDMAGFLSGNND